MIYLASSWHNPLYDGVVAVLKCAGLRLYDFKHPVPGNNGFHWSKIASNWANWTAEEYREALKHPTAELGFTYDMEALKACDLLVLVLPCGRSAHLELGYATGAGKPAYIYLPPGYNFEAELMYKAATRICLNMGELLEALGV